jgi:hypothetical protein
MAKEKKPVHKVQMTDGKRQIIQQLQEYNIETAEDIQDALKDLLGGTIKEMMSGSCEISVGRKISSSHEPMVRQLGCNLSYFQVLCRGQNRHLYHQRNREP